MHAGVAMAATTEARLPVKGVLDKVVDNVFSVATLAAGVVGLGMAAALYFGDVTDGARKFLWGGLGVAGIVVLVDVIRSAWTAGALI